MIETILNIEEEVLKSKGLAPKPPVEEQKLRIDRCRKIMEAHDLDGILIFGSAATNPEPVRYLANYIHVYPSASSFFYLPVQGDPVLMIDQGWHVVEAKKMSWVEDVRYFPNVARRWLADELKKLFADILAGSGLKRGNLGVFDTEMPAGYMEILKEAGPDVRMLDAGPVWQDLVATPTEYDMAMIRKNALVADKGQETAARSFSEGRTEYEVCFESLSAMAAMGAEFLHGSGVSTHVNTGSFSDCVGNVRPYMFTARPAEKGQMFWFDLTASCAGYYTDCCRTISIGEPNKEQQKIYEVCAMMYRAMEEAVRPGVTGGEVWEVGNQVAEEFGWENNNNLVYLGHTTGITTSVRPVIVKGEKKEIKAGSFVNIEPGIFIPGVGSAGLENTLYVSEDDVKPINQYSLDLFVI